MSYETRAYDNEHGDPVVVLVATGTHDVSRLVQSLRNGNCEQISVGEKVIRQVRRHSGGRAALRLLRDHGGPDFTAEPPIPTPEAYAAACHALEQWHTRRREALRLLRDWETADGLDTVQEWAEQIIGGLDAPIAGLETVGGEPR